MIKKLNYLLTNIAMHTSIATKKFVSIPNETAFANDLWQPASALCAKLGIPKL